MEDLTPFAKGFLRNYPTFYITSPFWALRKGGKRHSGIDIGCPSGTYLLSPIPGRIVKVRRNGYNNGAGGYIVLRHYDSSGTSYIDVSFMHLRVIHPSIKVGDFVDVGRWLAETGGGDNDPNKGHSTGSHLHLQVNWRNGTIPTNPLPFLYRTRCVYDRKTINHGTDEASIQYKVTEDEMRLGVTNESDTSYTDWSATEPDEAPPVKVDTVAKERVAPGIWQIVKLLVDSSVSNKQIFDSSISIQMGSILNFFHKVCQEPFVEFMGDTYGDQYYLIARRPPFDYEGMTKMMDLTMISLDEENIINTDLSWNNKGIYSWYKFLPYADSLGASIASFHSPAIFFPEYASVWGSKPYYIESNYFTLKNSGIINNDKKENKENSDNIIRGMMLDLKYLIQSNAYNPFTRQGTIKIIGDRRIKRGTLIRHITGEVFYVDSVSNSYEVNINGASRITTLNVSRGMYENFIKGVKINGKIYSYFNIINLGDTPLNEVTGVNYEKILSKWHVDVDAFGFFMRREQTLY